MSFKKMWSLFAVAAALGCAGCDMDGTNGNTNQNTETETVDWKNYAEDYAIKVSNNTKKNLIAFKGSLNTANIVGGIKASEQNHGFKNNEKLFAATGDFVLIVLTEEQYTKNKENLQTLSDTPFTRVYAFFNKSGTNENVYEISASLGGQYKLVLQNSSNMNVELRLNGVHGAPIGYAAEGMYNTTLNLDGGDYLVFPVFRKFVSSRGEIITVYPKFTANGSPKYEQFALSADDPELDLDLGTLIAGIELSTGSAYLLIQNNAGTGIQLRIGNTVQKTSTGISTINNAGNRLFQLDAAKTGAGTNDLAATVDISQYSIGTAVSSVKLDSLSNKTLDVDFSYTITVTRDPNTGTFILGEPVKGSKVSLND